MKSKAQVLAEMDHAAEQAKLALIPIMKRGSARDLAKWFKDWHQSAGHRRLGRILVRRAG